MAVWFLVLETKLMMRLTILVVLVVVTVSMMITFLFVVMVFRVTLSEGFRRLVAGCWSQLVAMFRTSSKGLCW